MAPTANDPYSPHSRRPRRTPEPGSTSDLACIICREAADAGEALALAPHEPAAHIGSTRVGVVLSREVTQDEGTLGTWNGEWSREWWEANTPDDVEVLDVYSPSTEHVALPDEIAAGLLANGATAEETQALEDRWNEGTDEDRAGAIAAFGEFTPEDWTAFVEGWRAAIADPDVVATLFLSPEALNGLRSEPTEEEAKGNALAAEQAEVDAWLAEQDDVPAAVEELIAWDDAVRAASTEGTPDAEQGDLPAEVPAGMVRVEVTVDQGEQGYTIRGDVPEEHTAVMDMLAASDGLTEQEQADRARLVLAAELTRTEAKRRKSILAAVTDTLGEAEVVARSSE